MHSSEFLIDTGYQSQAQKRNRQLIESEDLDDGFTRSRGLGGGQLLAPAQPPARRDLGPLIEEEMPESKPFFLSHGKANLARQIYDRGQAAKKPWKKGMPFSKATLDTFDTSSPYEKAMFGGIRNPRQAANRAANRPGGFQKLFGAKMSEDELLGREAAGAAPKKSFWGRLKNAVTGGGRKRSWMEMLFGARKRNTGLSAKDMGIKSTRAPMGVSSGWADQLVEASKAGRLGDDRDGDVGSEQLLAAEEQQQPAHQSAEHIVEEEEKVPSMPGNRPLLSAKEAKRSSYLEKLYAMQQMHAKDDVEDKGDDQQTVDDNSIEEDDDDGGGGYDPDLVNRYMRDDGDKPSVLQDHIFSIFNKQ